MREFEGKVAVVTGAASGMGKAFAERFALAGMKVVLADVEAAALERVEREFRQREFDALGVLADVSQPEAIEALAQRALDAYGKVHIVCNNAGVATDAEVNSLLGGPIPPLWEEPLKDWQWTFAVNFWGVVHGIRTFMPIMLAQNEEGHVVNTASIAGLTSGPALPIYGATKHAVVRVSEALHLQLVQRQAKVKVSVLCPGGVNTRIALASRNRPDEAWASGEERPAPEELERREQTWAAFTSNRGLPPEAVAEKVFQAIQDERFYILPHDEFDGAIQARLTNILERRNP
jgi:NAD(P)-dependent dehydrogenase (short-subunit alcohol dehydrogenase family)